MKKLKQLNTVILYGIFLLYLLFLFKILFLSRVSLLELFHGQRTLLRSINLIPFKSIIEYLFGNSAIVKEFAFGNVVGNIIIFIPLGLYLMLFKNRKRVVNILQIIFLISFLVELIQWLLCIGVSDIDDIILNCFGGWIGILGYQFLQYLLREEKKVQTTITIGSVIVGLPVLLFLLFMVRLRF